MVCDCADRGSRRLVEEKISATLVLAMRNMYQSKVRQSRSLSVSVGELLLLIVMGLLCSP